MCHADLHSPDISMNREVSLDPSKEEESSALEAIKDRYDFYETLAYAQTQMHKHVLILARLSDICWATIKGHSPDQRRNKTETLKTHDLQAGALGRVIRGHHTRDTQGERRD